MVMKLLSKSQLAQAQAAATKQTIDEGMKLAKRVDNLRDVVATEERGYEEFQRKTLQIIHRETIEAATKRDELLSEVKKLEKRKERALEPLTREKEEIKEALTLLADERKWIAEQLKEAEEIAKAAKAEKRKVAGALARAKTRELAAAEKFEAALACEDAAEGVFTTTKELEQKAQGLVRRLETEITQREVNCAIREEGIIMKEEQLQARETETSKQRKLLFDRQAMFERNIIRSKK